VSCFDPDLNFGEADPFAWDDESHEEECSGFSAQHGPKIADFNTQSEQFALKFSPELCEFVAGCVVGEVRVHGA